MEGKVMERNSFLSSRGSKAVSCNMLQEEGSELYEGVEYIPGREWAKWFASRRLSRSRSKP